ncbi:MAG: thioredoxin domain-containing protein [Oscillospiraceae bacterium]|jgi:uncharacterized protein YyaL (SSP411 family)|nr:thioredoxin domain-containing protein [Oscillospiraceae bacterium]
MKQANKLVSETSPYLLQHAYNPVSWFPWGEEAFQKAKQENKPVFLSVGYSTCHWCHVMAHESFEDDEVAAYLNQYYVSVKVDKEERPDIDAVYMEVCQALTGSGGWPLTIIMTPDQKPFFAGTYFPKHARYGQQGLLGLLKTIRQKWEFEHGELHEISESVTSQMRAFMQSVSGGSVNENAAGRAERSFAQTYDSQFGGFGRAPKFPQPHNLLFLLRCHHLRIGEQPLEMVENTLQSMIRGGIFDHVGYGFSRYSTDRAWLAPHFEKMLYDNALLVMTLAECWQVTRKEAYRYAAEKTLSYIKNEMTDPEGAFYSAEDADSEGEEGKFYTFTREEILAFLGQENGSYFCDAYDITEKGNFEGKNIPNLIGSAINFLMEPNLETMRKELAAYRKTRYALHKDDKILTAWNALMIAAYAKAYLVFGKEDYLHTAQKAFRFIEEKMQKEDGTLFISHRNGVSKGEGLLNDYAFFAWASLALYDATLDARYLVKTCELMQRILKDFADENGGFFLSPAHGEELLLRTKEQYDGAVPSGNSAVLFCLARLWHLTGDAPWREALDKQLSFYAELLNKHPAACGFALCGLLQDASPSERLVCVGEAAENKEKIAHEILGNAFRPFACALALGGEDAAFLANAVPTAKDYTAGESGFYLCRGNHCLPPVSTLKKVREILDGELALV